MKISLVMPNYNHAAYLAASIGGILAQSRPADEIIVIDDASTDDSLSILNELTAGNPSIRIVRNRERRGVVAALNSGLRMATGDLIAFLGADDVVFPDFLTTMEALLVENPTAAFSCARAVLQDSAGHRTGERPILRPTATSRYVTAGETRRQLSQLDNFFLAPVTLYRRDRLLELGGFDDALGSSSDGVLQRRLAVRWGYAFSPTLLGVWRLHGDNYSTLSATDVGKVEQIVSAAKRTLQAEPDGLFPPHYADMYEKRLRFNSARLMAGRLKTDPTVIESICSVTRGTALDRCVLAVVRAVGFLAVPLSTAWLALRLRPFAVSRVLAEGVHRLRASLRART